MPAQSPIALVTGASCGLGAEVARHLARTGAHVIVNHRNRRGEADTVVGAIRRSGGHASAVAADIVDDDAVTAMIDDVAHRFGHLDTLVLNAVTSTDAKPAKRDAQRRLVEAALPLMAPGARIVFITSNQAHFYPDKGVLKGYEPIAASKRADETTLYAMRAEFGRRGIHCTVVSGDFVDTLADDGTDCAQVVNLFPQHDPAVPEFAAAVARASVEPHPLSIVYAAGHQAAVPAAADGPVEALAAWHAAGGSAKSVRTLANAG